jgi:predicted RNase H-like nuclease (RuvC/YqgF family)
MALGQLKEKKMNTNLIPLNDKEEAILQLMQKINELEYENSNLKDEIKQLKWSLEEHD